MTEQRLTNLLQELAADAEVDLDTAADAWRIAGERRRNRRVTGSAALVAACVVVAVVAATTHHLGHQPPIQTAISSPSPPAIATAGPQLAPARSAEPGLSYLDSALPRSLDTSKTAAAALPPLAGSPVQRVVALAESTGDYETPAPIVVIGSDGRARRMDGVALGWVVDSGGNRSLPLDSGSLAPTGVLAAFAQKDAVVVVDLRSGIFSRLTVPGYNERVTWSPAADYLLVSGNSGSTLITVRTAKTEHLAAVDAASVAIPLDGGQPENLQPASVPHIDAWWGQAFPNAEQVVVGAFSAGLQVEGAPTADPQVLAVFDPNQPAAARLLAFDWAGRYKGCCAALGWLDKNTVLFSSEGGNDPVRILAWNVETKAVSRVSELTSSSVISVALQ